MTYTFIDFDKAEAKGKKNCSKGLACGAGCISKTKKCKQKIGAGGGAYADHIGDPANLEKGAESSEGKSISQGIPDLSISDFGKYLKGDLPKEQMQAIKDAIERPVVDPEKAAEHKPSMTREEAEKYVEGSAYGKESIWHGNSEKVSNSIADDGADPTKNARGVYGQGVYFAADKAVAEEYAKTAFDDNDGKASLIEAKFAIKKPFEATSSEIAKLSLAISENNGGKPYSKALSDYVKAKGHDSIRVTDYNYLVALDKAQVVSVANTKQEEGVSYDF